MIAKDHVYTLGIEEEFAIVDPETRELRSHIQEILEGGKVTLKEQIKPEMHQSVVELGTEICHSIVDARHHVVDLRSKLCDLAGARGLRIASAGTHPFSHWHEQLITEGERYETIVKDMGLLARANLIFGLHVHVGIPERETAIQVMNQARYFLPHIYALSVNSPFWVGRNTGLKGYRLKVFERFPRTGIPDAFESLSEYEDYCKLLVKTGCVDNAKKNLIEVPLAGTTIIHPVLGVYGAARVLLKPAAPGTGVIAGGAARVILEEAGIHDVLCKSLGSANHINVARATIAGLKGQRRPDEIAALRGIPAEDFVPKGLLDAYNATEKGGVPGAPHPQPGETGAA